MPGDTPENAEAKLRELLKEFSNVKIMAVTDLEDVPFFKQMFDHQQEQNLFKDFEAEDVEHSEDNVIDIKTKKPPLN